MLNDNFIKTANQLNNTSQKDVVKVANLVRKLQNLWRSWSDPDHQETVARLREEAAGTLHSADKLIDNLKGLNLAINSGNVEDYVGALNLVKMEIENLEHEVEELKVGANAEFNETASNLPEGFDLNLETEYETPLKEFSWFKNREPDLYFGAEPTKHLLLRTLNATKPIYSDRSEFVKKHLDGPNLKQFLQNFIYAVFNGILKGKIKETPNGRALKVETASFSIPNLPDIQLTATVRLMDNTRGLNARMSLRSTDNVIMTSGAQKPIVTPEKNEPIIQEEEIEELPIIETSRKYALTKLSLYNQRLPYQVTKLSDVEFAEALKEGYKKAFGKTPTAEILAGAWAQATLESGRPVKLPNNNIGNIKATSGWINAGSPYFIKDTAEFTGKGEKYIHRRAKWRAYSSPITGAVGYWNLIGGRYSKAMEWMAAGDPQSASIALGLKGYYTASPKQYATSVGRIYDYFMKKIYPQISDVKSDPTPPPGPKPELKKWTNDYSKEEKKAILAPKKEVIEETVILEEDDDDDYISKLMKRLVGNKPLTKLVKRSILKNQSGKVMISLSSKSSKIEIVEFANVLSSVIRKLLRVNADVCCDENNIEINCYGLVNSEKLAIAAQELSSVTSKTMFDKTGSFISPTVLPECSSKFNILDIDDILSNQRKYNLKRISNE